MPGRHPHLPGGWLRPGHNTFNFLSIYPGGFTPRFIGDTTELYGVLGYKGTAGGFGYDVSASQSRNTVDLGMHDSLNASYGADRRPPSVR